MTTTNMKNIYIRHEAPDGTPLPEGEMQIRKFGPEGFVIKVQVPVGNEAAWKYLQDIEQIMHWMGDRHVGDVDKGLRIVSDMESYFTTWRQGDKLVAHNTYEAMRRDREYQRSAKEALQRDNDVANDSDNKK